MDAEELTDREAVAPLGAPLTEARGFVALYRRESPMLLTFCARRVLVLYPHTGMYVETTGDAIRIAKAVDRSNVGVTFNLCHFLRVDKPENLERVLTEAAPLLREIRELKADVAALRREVVGRP